jgi:hypothetical protein
VVQNPIIRPESSTISRSNQVTRQDPVPLPTGNVVRGHHNNSNIDNSRHSNNNNNNKVNINQTNHFNINYNADLSPTRVFELIASKLGAHYISQGEEGLYDFILCEIFTDPSNPKNTAIACSNYKEQRFHYGVIDDDGNPIIKEDISLVNFNEYLRKYNSLIRTLITRFTPFAIGCLGYNDTETNRKVESLINTMIERKKMPSYMLKRIRNRDQRLSSQDTEIDDEMTANMLKDLEEQGKTSYMKHVQTDDEKLAMSAYNIREGRMTPQKKAYIKLETKAKLDITDWDDEKNCMVIKNEEEELRRCQEEDIRKGNEIRRKEQEKQAERDRREKIRQEHKAMKEAEAKIERERKFQVKKEKLLKQVEKQAEKQSNIKSKPLKIIETIQEE